MSRYDRGSRDDNEPSIIEALEACGWAVERVAGCGFDLVAKHLSTGVIKFIEVKNLKGHRDRRRPSQKRSKALFGDSWVCLRTVAEAIDLANSAP